jgi:cytoskeletal protein CcmA (bactofilin family)
MWKMNENVSQGTPDEHFTFLSKGARFQGVVNFEGTVRVDGMLNGEITTNGTLIVGEQGRIRGTILVGTLTVSGHVHATVRASEKIEVLKPGILFGNIQAPRIMIENGACYQGHCEMGLEDSNAETFDANEAGPSWKSNGSRGAATVKVLPSRSDV